jgi:nucleotide-binding universal stress UspA family protein
VFNKVMIGIDEHEGGRDAIALARQLVSDDGELSLAYVHGGFPLVGRGSNADFEAGERDRAETLLSSAAAGSGIETTRCIGSTSVGRGLHELAEANGADLLVIGSTRRGLLGRVLVGDDTRHALDGAPCAVAVAPAGYAQHPTPFTEIGVAYNGSVESKHALQVARALAADRHAKVSAFEAVTLPDCMYVPDYMYTGIGVAIPVTPDADVDAARARIEDLRDVEAHAAFGDPAEELAVYSASLDLLVVGSRDFGPIGRLMHGSTTHRLARLARCPLLVLTRAARAGDTVSPNHDDRHALAAGA